MKTFNNSAAQGDCLLLKIEKLPADVSLVEAENGQFVVAHSETGHNHCVKERPTVKLYASVDQFRGYLEVTGDQPAVLEHHRSFDTHESLEIKPGIYEIRRQREYTPEGFRRAAD
jgi:hypothetical protein